jgi:hypothetical protein
MNEFGKFKQAMQKQFAKMIESGDQLFVTDVEKDVIWETYLESFPIGTNEVYRERREFDCSCCRHFLKPYGNIVSIVDNQLVSIWDIMVTEHPFNLVAKKLSALVKSAPIKNVFVAKFERMGTDKSHEQMDDGHVHTWEHFYFKIPKSYMNNTSKSIDGVRGYYRDNKNVFQRSMNELTLDSGQTILEIIEQGSLYRGEEHKKAVKSFIEYKNKYADVLEEEKENWLWKNSFKNPVVRIRNTAIGTLLIDLSDGVGLDDAVTKFEKNIMAPSNYKRPKALITKKMIDEAEIKIGELGFIDSLGRRFAAYEDITVNNVLFVNRDAKKKINSSVFDDLKSKVPDNPKKFAKVEEIGIEDFIKNIIPTATNIELMIEYKHINNLMSLVAPENKKAPSMLKWNNNFSWAYTGDIADSMKQRVKNAGGNVEGILRFSIQWNDPTGSNKNDFDAHCIEPDGNEIYFGDKTSRLTSGELDVDIINPGNKIAVENITWINKNKMLSGKYKFFVRNFSHNGGTNGFTAEIEYDGEIYAYDYPHELRQNEDVMVAKIEFDKKKGIKFIYSLDSIVSTKEIWGIPTNKFTRVSVGMFSPNYWDGQKNIGNKHYFFFLEGCKNESAPRGFFNEFLKEDLTEHKRVFEALGSKMRVEHSDNQLSGLGFSSTQRNNIIAKVEGSFSRTIKINF